MMKKVFVT